eukprot:5984373-Pyramimonas_sp.AAC.3
MTGICLIAPVVHLGTQWCTFSKGCCVPRSHLDGRDPLLSSKTWRNISPTPAISARTHPAVATGSTDNSSDSASSAVKRPAFGKASGLGFRESLRLTTDIRTCSDKPITLFRADQEASSYLASHTPTSARQSRPPPRSLSRPEASVRRPPCYLGDFAAAKRSLARQIAALRHDLPSACQKEGPTPRPSCHPRPVPS